MASEESDNYRSSEDEDYVPNVDGPLCDESSEEEATKAKGGRKRKKLTAPKKRVRKAAAGRVGGIRLEEEEEEESSAEEIGKDVAEADQETSEEKERKKAELDRLFMEELGMAPPKKASAAVPKPKPATKKTPRSLSGYMVATKAPKKKKVIEFRMPGSSKPKPKPAEDKKKPDLEAALKQEGQEKVTLTKSYDFAGETVVITKEVTKDSKEAKAHARAEAKKQNRTAVDDILGTLGKKKGMSTLAKSQLDWDSFTEENGIKEDLDNQNKDGYLDKVSFLKRAELRQYELEKSAQSSRRR